MASWMFDPLACAAMTLGPPRVDWAALNKVSPAEAAIAQEVPNEDSPSPSSAVGLRPVEAAVRHRARLVGWLCAGQVGAVVCFDASRLARNGQSQVVQQSHWLTDPYRRR
jgi:hypothetical protein